VGRQEWKTKELGDKFRPLSPTLVGLGANPELRREKPLANVTVRLAELDGDREGEDECVI
jgi:hypothetical protein